MRRLLFLGLQPRFLAYSLAIAATLTLAILAFLGAHLSAMWLVAWRNWGKQFSEQHGGGTPAMRAKQCDGQRSVTKMLDGRRFFTRTSRRCQPPAVTPCGE